MKLLLKNGNVFIDGKFTKTDVEIVDNKITKIESTINNADYDKIFDLNNKYILPGLIDVHTHLREPGFEYKETIKNGALTAAHGGYTSICAMPNLNPVPDCKENLKKETDIIERDAIIHVYPFGAITKNEEGKELAEFEEIANSVIGFSDDGHGVQNGEIMEKAMEKAYQLNKIISAHCEDNELLNGGYIHDGEYARIHGHKGICSESEWKPIKRDIELSRKTGCHYHVCHVSTKESVELIRNAKAEGVRITAETAPHYLLLNDMQLQEDGRFKMNPPIRSEEDRQALIAGIKDGTIDCIITDHAPHSAEEKSKGLQGSAMGVVGMEASFPELYTNLVKKNIISFEKLVELMNTNPRRIFGIGTEIKEEEKADIAVFSTDEEFEINPDNFVSKGKATPFAGDKVYGKCILTICDGNIVFEVNNK